MDKIKIFFKRNFAYFLTLFIILLFLRIAYFLWVKKELITEEAFFSNVLVFVGWIIALLIAWIHIRKNREDNLAIQNNEIKKRLEIEAFKEINKAIEKTATILAEKETCCYHMYERMNEACLNNTRFTISSLRSLKNTYNKMSKRTMGLPELWKIFNLNINAHEIILIEFEELLSILENKFMASILLTLDFEKLFLKLKKKNSLTRNDLLKLKKECMAIKKNLSAIGLSLNNYRVETMNKIMGPIFDRKIQK